MLVSRLINMNNGYNYILIYKQKFTARDFNNYKHGTVKKYIQITTDHFYGIEIHAF